MERNLIVAWSLVKGFGQTVIKSISAHNDIVGMGISSHENGANFSSVAPSSEGISSVE